MSAAHTFERSDSVRYGVISHRWLGGRDSTQLKLSPSRSADSPRVHERSSPERPAPLRLRNQTCQSWLVPRAGFLVPLPRIPPFCNGAATTRAKTGLPLSQAPCTLRALIRDSPSDLDGRGRVLSAVGITVTDPASWLCSPHLLHCEKLCHAQNVISDKSCHGHTPVCAGKSSGSSPLNPLGGIPGHIVPKTCQFCSSLSVKLS